MYLGDRKWRALSFIVTVVMILSTTVIGVGVDEDGPMAGEVDVCITDQDIEFSDSAPALMDTVTISATVHGDASSGTGDWVKHGVVVDISGWGEDDRVSNPFVLTKPDGSYVMFYNGRPSGATYNYRIFRAVSTDGINWTKQGMVLDFGGAYETYGAYSPDVVVDGTGVYHMWYTGLGYSGGYRAYILKATSYDEGFTWIKNGLDLNYGSGCDPDGVNQPSVLFDGSQWHMWYGGIDWGTPNQVRICHAHKTNIGGTWVKDGVVLNNDGPYDYPSASMPNVIPVGSGYEMFYTGYTPGGAYRVLHATSVNGYDWVKKGISIEGSLPLETNQVGMASVLVGNITSKMWYSACDGTYWRILYAERSPADPGVDATCTASFYLDSVSQANLIDEQTGIFVPANGQTTVTTNWVANVSGSHSIIVEVTDVDPPDIDMLNNAATSVITVDAPLLTDLSIYDPDITFSDATPYEGQTIDVGADIHGDESRSLGWNKYGLVVNVGPPGSPDDYYVNKPSIVKLANGTYLMFYCGRNSGTPSLYNGNLFRAFSYDGVTWFKQGIVMSYGNTYETEGVMYPYVYVCSNGTYYLWYTGIGYNSGYRYYIHRAISYDQGLTWLKHGLEMSFGTAYDPDGVYAPFVHFDGSEWHMWYCGISWSSSWNRICHAHKANLEDPWIKDGIVINNNGPYDSGGSQRPWVIPTPSGYEMYYTGYDGNLYRLLKATSPDGIAWTRIGIEIEPTLPEESIFVMYASFMKEGDIYKCWYGGNNPNRIFYADKFPFEQGLNATCTVSFYLDSVSEPNLIDRQFNVYVPADGQTPVSRNWVATAPGSHTIYVKVSDVDPPDSDLSNNIACQAIEVLAVGNETATATGPQGAHHDPVINITYEWTESPVAVDLYYSTDAGETWNFLATDDTVDGVFMWEPTANPGPKPSKYYWIANAKFGADDVGVPADGTAPEAGPFNWKSWDLCQSGAMPMSGGDPNWYFISIPLDVSGDLLTVFDDAEWGDGGTTWDYIQWYDAQNQEWKSYSIYRPAVLNDNVAVTNGMGFWIHLAYNDGDGALTVGEGVEPVSTAVQLYAGWNLVGYPTQTEGRTVSDVFWGTGVDKVEVFDPSAPYHLVQAGSSYIMQPGEAYWVHVMYDSVWVVDW